MNFLLNMKGVVNIAVVSLIMVGSLVITALGVLAIDVVFGLGIWKWVTAGH